MRAKCPLCNQLVEFESLPQNGQHVLCPHCNEKYSFSIQDCPLDSFETDQAKSSFGGPTIGSDNDSYERLGRCPGCKKVIPASSKFCPACGKPLLVNMNAAERARYAPKHTACQEVGFFSIDGRATRNEYWNKFLTIFFISSRLCKTFSMKDKFI